MLGGGLRNPLLRSERPMESRASAPCRHVRQPHRQAQQGGLGSENLGIQVRVSGRRSPEFESRKSGARQARAATAWCFPASSTWCFAPMRRYRCAWRATTVGGPSIRSTRRMRTTRWILVAVAWTLVTLLLNARGLFTGLFCQVARPGEHAGVGATHLPVVHEPGPVRL